MNNQPKALRLAKSLDHLYNTTDLNDLDDAATELRRLHEANQIMLEALKSILEDMDSEHGTDYDYAKARAAIAKGEQQ